jgi:hypothetical protein
MSGCFGIAVVSLTGTCRLRRDPSPGIQWGCNTMEIVPDLSSASYDGGSRNGHRCLDGQGTADDTGRVSHLGLRSMTRSPFGPPGVDQSTMLGEKVTGHDTRDERRKLTLAPGSAMSHPSQLTNIRPSTKLDGKAAANLTCPAYSHGRVTRSGPNSNQ